MQVARCCILGGYAPPMPTPSPVKPRRLVPGDTVAVVSPSWGGPSAFPHVHEAGLATLRGLGLEVRELPATRLSVERLLADPRARADDVNAAFADRSVRFLSAGANIQVIAALATRAAGDLASPMDY